MSGSTLIDGERALVDVFRRSPSKRAAHLSARPILEQLSRTPAFLTGALERYLGRGPGLVRGHYPVVAVPVASNPWFELSLNCWIPLPTRATDMSTKAVHHHGSLYLSTVNVFGPGYEHWLFGRPRARSSNGAADPRYSLRLLDVSRHRPHQVVFVDSDAAHVPMFPESLSITLALWSGSAPTTVLDRVKRIPELAPHKKRLRDAAVGLGLAKALDLKVVRDFDFIPCEGGGFRVMQDRIEFALGPNVDHLHSVFHILQQTGNEHLSSVAKATAERIALPNAAVVRELAERSRGGQPIEGRLSPGHYDIPFANFHADQLRAGASVQEP